MKKHEPLSVFDRGPQDTAHSEMLRLLAVTQEQAAEISRLRAECFSLAARQCANVTADESGTPQCAEISRLRAKLIQQIDYPRLIADCYSRTNQEQGTMTLINQDAARSIIKSIGDDDRAAIIDRARTLREQIAQAFADADHWNRVNVPWKGPAIDPDPDGELKRISASLDKMLASVDTTPNVDLTGAC